MAKLITVFFLAFLCTTANAQVLGIEFTGTQPTRLAFKAPDGGALWGDETFEIFDLNRDGISEVVMQRDDAQGTPQELVVVNVAASPHEVLWTLDLSAVGGALDTKFHGFFDIWPGVEDRVAVFSGEGILIVDDSGVVFSLDADHRLLGVVDYDSDGLAELIVENTVEDVIQVWGAGAAGRPRR